MASGVPGPESVTRLCAHHALQKLDRRTADKQWHELRLVLTTPTGTPVEERWMAGSARRPWLLPICRNQSAFTIAATQLLTKGAQPCQQLGIGNNPEPDTSAPKPEAANAPGPQLCPTSQS
jgi:hypothetical protein